MGHLLPEPLIDSSSGPYFPLRLKLGPPPADNPFKTFIIGETLDKYPANRLLILKRKIIPANSYPTIAGTNA
jgi:hypothetical protein